MGNRKAKATAVCILGMHRSGTSLLTRAVNLLGAYIGEEEELMQPSPANPEGYWEHQRIYELHDRVLAALGRTWDTAFPLPADWHKSSDIVPFHDELIELIETRFAGRPLWTWKDPRTCILLPLWQVALARFRIELRCLLVVRNPLDVARSLQVREGFSMEEGFGLWFNHNLAMLRNSGGLPRALVSYQQFLEDPQGSVSSWAPALALRWPPKAKEVDDAVRRVVRPDLCHSASKLRDLSRAGCPKPVIELTRVLDAMARKGDIENPDYEPKIRRLLETHISLSGLYRHDFVRARRVSTELNQQLVDNEVRLRNAQSQSLEFEQRTNDVMSQLAEKEKQVAEASTGREAIEQQSQMRERELGEARQLIAARDQEIGEARKQRVAIELQLQQHEQSLADVRQLIAARDKQLMEGMAQRETIERRLQEQEQALADAQQLNAARDAELADAAVQRETLVKELQAGARALAEAQALAAARNAELAEAAEIRASIDEQLRSQERELVESRELIGVREKELAEAGERRDMIERQLRSRESDLADARDLVLTRSKQLAESAIRRESIERQLRESEGEVAARREELAKLEMDLAEAHASYQRITSTYSWRVTEPLRVSLGAMQAVKRTLLAIWHKLLPKKS